MWDTATTVLATKRFYGLSCAGLPFSLMALGCIVKVDGWTMDINPVSSRFTHRGPKYAIDVPGRQTRECR